VTAVLICDDRRQVREGLTRVMSAVPGVARIDCVAHGDELLARYSRQPVDVVLVGGAGPEFSYEALNEAFGKAGVTAMPTTLRGFSGALQTVARANSMSGPPDIHLATADGLSTCWYQVPAACGGRGTVADVEPVPRRNLIKTDSAWSSAVGAVAIRCQ